jgi:membrane-bound lytic murein transglycosylase D
MVTPPDTSFDLHLPAGAAALFQQRIAAIPEGKRTAWRYHRVKSEDTLASVAREYRVTAAELAAANQLKESDSVQAVEALVVPSAPAAAPAARAMLYTARKGETLVTISDRFGVSLSQLRRWNHLAGIKVQPGQRLHIADPASAPRATSRGHRRGRVAVNEDTPEAAPAKGATAKSAASGRHRKSSASAAEKVPAHGSGAAAAAKNKGTASAAKSPARGRAAKSKTHSAK